MPGDEVTGWGRGEEHPEPRSRVTGACEGVARGSGGDVGPAETSHRVEGGCGIADGMSLLRV